MPSLVTSFDVEKRKHCARASMDAYRVPAYAGHLSGHQHVAGFSHGAICCGDAGPTTYAAIGDGAPGTTAHTQRIKGYNLQPGTKMPVEVRRTKTGYTGHLPGRHYSSNFGKPFALTATELLATGGKPAEGGVADPGQPFKADTSGVLSQSRPARLKSCIAGYQGFRPRTTPIW